MNWYDVFVNVPHAFTRVTVQAESPKMAKAVALAKVQQEDAAFRETFRRWADDETGKVPYPEKPHEWTSVITALDVADGAFVEDSDVEVAVRQREDG